MKKYKTLHSTHFLNDYELNNIIDEGWTLDHFSTIGLSGNWNNVNEPHFYYIFSKEV